MYKFKLKKTFKLANPKIWIAPWEFTEGQILDTEDEYLYHRLLQLDAIEILDKGGRDKGHITPLNKMLVVEENKSVIDDTPQKEVEEKPVVKKVVVKKLARTVKKVVVKKTK